MPSVIATVMLLSPLILILFGLTLTVLTDTYISKTSKYLMLMFLIMTNALVVQNTVDFFLDFGEPRVLLREIIGTWGYVMRPVILVLFFKIIDNGRKFIIPWILVGINAAIYLSDLFIRSTFYTFTYTGDTNVFIRGRFGYTCHIISIILICYLAILIIRNFANAKKQMILPFLSTVLIVASLVIDSKVREMEQLPLSALTMAIIVSCVFYFFWIHNMLVAEHDKDLRAQQQVKIMMSQIQPHFLYNTLSTIQALCLTNPEEASEITGKFGKYLRQNLDSPEQPDLIPLDKELEHTKVYADIEKVRFPNISVEYDIKYRDFCLPALTIQPLVENAIRHGVRNREHGIVTVLTERTDAGIVISVKDNGVGFDTNAARKVGSHIGLINVAERIEKMCGGTLVIQSEIGKSTTVTITIPEGED